MYEDSNERIPINLKEKYGDRFKIGLDEAAFCEDESKKDPWYFKILCKYGDIYPVSDKKLGFHCTGERIRGRLHKEHPEIEVQNWSDDGEAIFIFEPEQFDIIAEYAKPRLKPGRKKLSQNERKKLENAGLGHRYKCENTGKNDSYRAQFRTNERRPISDYPPAKNRPSEIAGLKQEVGK